MRLRIFFLASFIFLMLLPFAAAETVLLKVDQSKMISGKNLTLIAVYSDFIVVDVDGTQKDIKYTATPTPEGINFSSRTFYVSGVNLTVTNIFERQNIAELRVEVAFVCGDNICSSSETQTTCCKDCNCSSGYTCADNRCIESKLNECTFASECNDNNVCTTDLCEGIPRKCYNLEITLCNDNDDCCPQRCYYENDSDCPRSKTTLECFSAKDCIDAFFCTADYCENGKCMHETKAGCESNGTCLPINSTGTVNNAMSYCTAVGWQQQKKSKEACKENFECLSNLCEQEKCAGAEPEPKKTKANFFLIAIAAAIIITIVILFLRLRKF